MRIATWNLRRPRRMDARLERLLDKIRKVDADVWILTETHDEAVPGPSYCSKSSSELGGIFGKGERRTTIWTRLPIIAEIQVFDEESAACVEVQTTNGKMIVYGTVLPYGNAGTNYEYNSGGKKHVHEKSWKLHYDSILEHEQDLSKIQALYPEHAICFGGDLNQSRDGRRWGNGQWYGTGKGRELLSQSLENRGLICLTEQDFVDSRHLTTRSNIDHLCLNKRLDNLVTSVIAWESTQLAGKQDTDHNGVYIDISI